MLLITASGHTLPQSHRAHSAAICAQYSTRPTVSPDVVPIVMYYRNIYNYIISVLLHHVSSRQPTSTCKHKFIASTVTHSIVMCKLVCGESCSSYYSHFPVELMHNDIRHRVAFDVASHSVQPSSLSPSSLPTPLYFQFHRFTSYVV